MNMHEFFSILLSGDVPFVRYALIASLLSSFPLGMIGSFVVVKHMGSIAGAISHSVIGGIGLALYLQIVLNWRWVTPQIGTLVFSVLSGLLLSWFSIKGKQRFDTVINSIWVIGMSLGLVFLSLTPTYTDPMSYLFGNILLISQQDLILVGILSFVVIFVVTVFFPQLKAVSFDEEFSKIRGIPVSLFSVVLLLLVSITVFLMLQVVGALMVIALLTLPPAIASIFHRRLSSIMITSTLITILFSFIGLMVSFLANLPTGPVTVLILGSAYLGVVLLKRIIPFSN
jgi:zinc transport system permease protein